MTTGLARASVRARPSSFAGVFSVLVLSATVVTASVAMLRTASGVATGEAREELTTMGAGFTVVTVYLSIFVIAQVMALAVAQRARENAVLRAVGAAPWQIRRTVATEALLTALPALPVGYGLGCVLARVWRDGMAAHGILPKGVPLTVGWVPALVAGGVLLVTSQLGGLLAAQRAARARPVDALGESAVPRRGVTPMRVIRGCAALAALIGAGALTALTAQGPREDVGEHLPLVLLAYLVAVGLAGPALGRIAAVLVAVPLRLTGYGAASETALATVRAYAGRLSSAVTPVALVVAFTLVKLAALAATDEPSWIDLFATVLYAVFAAFAAANTMVMLTAERRREVALLRAVGAGPGQVARMLVVEALTTTVAGFGAGALVALAVTLPLGDAAGAPLSSLGAGTWAATGAGVLALALLSTLAPLPGHLRRALR
ncbi:MULTISPECIES: FtsX-like permease family protein [unclassified Streptomyces]|uniref:ABC transporter permease n=1 Tax=unclassified Streptomyces TaxID=2593676 RepID=UPI002DD98A15|nr:MULTISPECIES: FtsX-like permease family protein [unclassified Streptomyces]WSA93541.1 ABC transporter permease [Streptomyces sp. NBC_01795]WSB77910.1 ABC transporter permease [Streptomyces sp. NBC_01775]WSS13832.1 ABC transporter permease [Streptomyces sp. NBC_01186]WSS42657.1 ABC transporter permease [Streptomyces sp. NBC_01187]